MICIQKILPCFFKKPTKVFNTFLLTLFNNFSHNLKKQISYKRMKVTTVNYILLIQVKKNTNNFF